MKFVTEDTSVKPAKIRTLPMNIKTESAYKGYKKFPAGRLGWRDLVVYLKEVGSASALGLDCRTVLVKVENVSQEKISVLNLINYRVASSY
jgi:hypothetical protein